MMEKVLNILFVIALVLAIIVLMSITTLLLMGRTGMSGVVSLLPQAFKVTAFGMDGSDYVVLKVDANGQLYIVNDKSNPFYVKQRYDSRYIDVVTATAGAGVNNLNFPAVTDDYLIITDVVGLNVTTGGIIYTFGVYEDGTDYRIFHRSGATAANTTSEWHGTLVLGKDDILQVRLSGCNAGDDIRAYAFGYYVIQ